MMITMTMTLAVQKYIPGGVAEHEESTYERHGEGNEEAGPPRTHPLRRARRQF